MRILRSIGLTVVLITFAITAASAAEDALPQPPSKENNVSHSGKGPHKLTNALARETSPYLLQHAHNPVNWYPWGPEAFEKAKKEDKPIFLSVGYSSCHWCHVMERESFENEAVAKVLNDHFISIKVDREERPDVDEIYMTAVQVVTQRGGWPMTVFMNHDGKPFFGGTYFPPDDRQGRMGFVSLLERVNEIWTTRKEDVLKDAENLTAVVREHLARAKIPAETRLDGDLLKRAVEQIHENFDPVLGGFGSRPKFPPNNGLPLLLHLRESLGVNEKIDAMNTLTLDQMAMGGIHDHLAGGFHRYSTDERWLLPHFEKMLYDNALLSRSYAQASVIYNNPEYARVARGVHDWVLREMTSPEGGFYSTLDADSEGHEGKFYVWRRTEIEQLLGTDAAEFSTIFNILPEGNFKEEATGEDTGLNIPHLTQPYATHAARLKISEADLRKKVDAWKATLLAVRIKRVWPALDDKILTAWNGLMISSLARGAKWLNEPRYKDAAVKAAEFLLKNLCKDGRWLATHRHGQSKLAAYLDDHAFMAIAFLDLFDTTGDARWKTEAIDIVKVMDTHFADKNGGGYFFTADDHEVLLARTKDPVDKAIPSGNGWAAQALVRLAEITGDNTYRDKALALIQEVQGLMERAPQATESILLGFAYHLKSAPASAAMPAGAKPQSSATRGPVFVELLLGSKAVPAGGTLPVAVRFTTDIGWHIQAHSDDKADVAATRISLVGDEIGKLETPKYPVAQKLSAPALGGDLDVYAGAVLTGGSIAVPKDAKPGQQIVKLKVHFQACNDKVCEKPEDVVLSAPLEVVPAGTKVEAINASVFDELNK
jgi:uncharacterized protein